MYQCKSCGKKKEEVDPVFQEFCDDCNAVDDDVTELPTSNREVHVQDMLEEAMLLDVPENEAKTK